MPESIPRRTFVQALRCAEICVSPATLSELETVLGRGKFERYLDRPTRNAFLALALSCSAIALISSDQDLSTLTSYEGISIVTPRLFLDRSLTLIA